MRRKKTSKKENSEDMNKQVVRGREMQLEKNCVFSISTTPSRLEAYGKLEMLRPKSQWEELWETIHYIFLGGLEATKFSPRCFGICHHLNHHYHLQLFALI